MYKESRMIATSNNVIQYEKYDGTIILFNTDNAKYIHVNPKIRKAFQTVYYELSQNSDLEKKIMKRLVEDEFIVSTDKIVRGYAKSNDHGKVLHITLMPTENCNFRCRYCFEQHKTNLMSKKIQDAIVESIDKIIEGYESLLVSWYGGEPLLYISIIEYLSARLMEICRSKRKTYMASITTNGYNLTYDNYLKLRSYNIVNFTITIDGVKEDHNYYRRSTLNNGDTYTVIMSNLKQIKAREKSHLVHFVIRTNFTKKSVINKSRWEYILKENFLRDDRFTYLPRIAWNGTGSESLKKEILDVVFSDNLSFVDNLPTLISKDNETIVENIIPQSARVDGSLKQIIESELEAVVNGSFICGAGYKSTMTISPDGDILKCQINLKENYNIIGHVNVENGQFDMDVDKSKLWEFENVEPKCRSCNLFPCCKGIGCPLKVRNPTWCSNLYDHILRRLIALTYCKDSVTIF